MVVSSAHTSSKTTNPSMNGALPKQKVLPSLLPMTTLQKTLLAFCAGFYLWGFIWRTQAILDETISHRMLMDEMMANRRPSPSHASTAGYIMVLPFDSGQGIGNYMNGLLAAHMLGKEFRRTVCVSTRWTDFHKAFRSRDHHEECSKLPQRGKGAETINLVSYGIPANECFLKPLLANASIPILFFKGNTYPRWAPVEPKFWDQFYEITPELQSILPWKKPPTTVVHLRKPDSDRVDPRKGLDTESLAMLGKTLGADTFLVTNNVEWYDYFQTEFQWSNPGWLGVTHSATKQRWGKSKRAEEAMKPTHDPMMELWADWYTILQATRVFHTHSDFSLSAIHWRQLDSKTLFGTKMDSSTNELVLDLIDEPWRRDEIMLPLVQREGSGLANCNDAVHNVLVDDFFLRHEMEY